MMIESGYSAGTSLTWAPSASSSILIASACVLAIRGRIVCGAESTSFLTCFSTVPRCRALGATPLTSLVSPSRAARQIPVVSSGIGSAAANSGRAAAVPSIGRAGLLLVLHEGVIDGIARGVTEAVVAVIAVIAAGYD